MWRLVKYLNNCTLTAEVNKQREQTDMKPCYNLGRLLCTVELHYLAPWQQSEDVAQTLKARTSALVYHLKT